MSMPFYRLPITVTILLAIAVLPLLAQGTTVQNLAPVKTIYVMPMRGGMDHYVTNELVQWGKFQVTVDPRQADALLSDSTKVNINEIMNNPQRIQKGFSTRGTLFIIDVHSEQVLWSAYKKPNEPFILGGDKSNPELAHDMIGALKKELGAQK